jgi:predicted dehydrogenase
VVVIATPTVAHHGAIRQILESVRPKAIICEKPLAYGLRDAEAMVANCLRCGVDLYVNYMRCSDPGVIAVMRMIQGGEIQSPVKGVVWYSKGLIHNGSHFVHLVRRWFGAPKGASVIRAGRSWGDLDAEPDFLMEYAGAAMTFLAAREECFSHYTVELVAQNGRLRYEEGGARIGWQRVIDDPESPGYQVLEPEPTLVRADMARSQLNVVGQLEKALNGMPSDLCTGNEALETLRDIHRIIKLQ